MKGQELWLINIYGPQSKWDRKCLFTRIKPYLFTSRQVVFGGDFNTVTRPRDRGGSRDKLTYDSVALNSIASEARLVDVHIRHTAGHEGFTYHRGNCRSRIDRFYLKEEAVSSAVSVVEVEFSDHCLILFSLNVTETPWMGRGFWRLNSSLLEEAEIRQSFEDFLQSQLCVDFISRTLTVDMACEALQAAVSYGQNDLQQRCLSFIERHTVEIIKTQSFRELSDLGIVNILQSDRLSIDEVPLIQAVREWAYVSSVVLDVPVSVVAQDAVRELRLILLSPDELTTLERENGKDDLIPEIQIAQAWKFHALKKVSDTHPHHFQRRKGTLGREHHRYLYSPSK
ncbi:BTB/POZ domain-containing protein 19 isoform X1 [Phyllobates terribilis]|uniref:BTB/POZ domain-containing protein 19 isoform X1 n=1 Tax=Phyllobates terribilis TaxID=111132 RepID=UPI003CCAE2B8